MAIESIYFSISLLDNLEYPQITDGGSLAVEGKLQKDHHLEGGGICSTNLIYHGSLQLPYGVAAENITAKYEHGLLEVYVPKPASQRRMIEF